MVEQILKEKIKQRSFGVLPDGRAVTCFELSNKTGIVIRVLNYGGIIQAIETPDRLGHMEDIVLGFNTLEGYLNNVNYHGALVGRYANRIARAKFSIGDQEYALEKNDGMNCLHGGTVGFNRMIWDAKIISKQGRETLRLSYTSPDGDQGFPGDVKVTADYSLSDANKFSVDMSASTNKPTIVSLTIHPYFNLTGDSQASILDHRITLNSDHYLPVSHTLVPLGRFENVSETPFDLRTERVIGTAANMDHEQLKITNGIDHCFVNRLPGDANSCLGKLFDPVSGRILKVFSDAPGVQLYTGNYLSADNIGKGNKAFKPWGGVCLEPQEFPNAPNEPGFGYKPLHPGGVYKHSITFGFATDSEELQ